MAGDKMKTGVYVLVLSTAIVCAGYLVGAFGRYQLEVDDQAYVFDRYTGGLCTWGRTAEGTYCVGSFAEYKTLIEERLAKERGRQQQAEEVERMRQALPKLNLPPIRRDDGDG
jgi:hypothetical protein